MFRFRFCSPSLILRFSKWSLDIEVQTFSVAPRAPSHSHQCLGRRSEQDLPPYTPILGDFSSFQGGALGNAWTMSISHLPRISDLLYLSLAWCHHSTELGKASTEKTTQRPTRMEAPEKNTIFDTSLGEANIKLIPAVSLCSELENAQRGS